jgi:CubicO group peptidase (beta-lactamase class C family)
LVDEGRIDLDRSIAEYLPRPLPEYEDYHDLAGDERWRRLTMRMLLNHTSGFANFRWLDEDQKLRFHRDPGARFGYSGEGLYVAQLVLEQGLHLNVKDEMQRRVFDRFGMTRTSMQWRDDFEGNLTQGYGLDGTMEPHDHRDNVSAAGSMDTTIADWTNFLAGAVRGEGLSPAAYNEMIRRSIVIDSATQFPSLTQARADWSAIGLGYAVGWGVLDTPYGHAFFKEGHNDTNANYAICIAARRDCVVFISNSVRAEGIYLYLTDALLGPTNLPWSWESYTPYDRQAPAQ